MPDQKDCIALNDAMMLSRNRRESEEEQRQRYRLHMGYIQDRKNVQQYRQERRDRLELWLDGVLVGACLMGMAVAVAISLGLM